MLPYNEVWLKQGLIHTSSVVQPYLLLFISIAACFFQYLRLIGSVEALAIYPLIAN